jgi:hypothetical protein
MNHSFPIATTGRANFKFSSESTFSNQLTEH